MEMNDDNVMDRTRYTYKERTLLLKLRRKPRDWAYLQAVADANDDAMNVMLSDIGKLYYVKGKSKDGADIKTDMFHLNQMGETVAQAEFDHRFELYFNRAISFLALLVSIAAIVVSVI